MTQWMISFLLWSTVLTVSANGYYNLHKSVVDPALPRRHRRHHNGDSAAAGPHQPSDLKDRFKRHWFENENCPVDCHLWLPDMQQVRSRFQDLLEEADTRLVYFKVDFPDYNANRSMLEVYPYMGNNVEASEWVWASQHMGRNLLGLPLDADVLSLYILYRHRKQMELRISSTPKNCLVRHSPECRLYAVRKILMYNVTYAEAYRHRRDFVCHRIINDTGASHSELIYRCCDTAEFRSGNQMCQTYTTYSSEVSTVLIVINVIAVIITLFSPVVIMKIKIALKFDSVTKFFRASLKHGITGQRNYVIRISSRQLINLSDPKPFSIPRFLFRIAFHCYGEGRCCIHWWGDWMHQPSACRRHSWCRRIWMAFWRIFAMLVVYPSLVYAAIALYGPRLAYYMSILRLMEHLEDYNPLQLQINLVGAALIPMYQPAAAIWLLFSFLAFAYTVLLLSWPNNPLERCLLRYEGKRAYEQPLVLYDRMTRGYHSILQKLAYGEFNTKRHFFRIPWIPWGIRRTTRGFGRLLLQVPVFSICYTTLMLDSKVFGGKGQQAPEEDDPSRDKDETHDPITMERPSCRGVCRVMCAVLVWMGFILMLAGYCTMVYVLVELILNVAFFTLVGAVLHASAVLPWLCFCVVLIFYMNDSLAIINREHRDILKLIDENSPRISAVEDSEDVFRDGSIQILKTHNLGAVKFIDGDNTEYVSKELYYNVCTDLRCGWSRSLRRVCARLSVLFLFVLFVFLTLSSLSTLVGSAIGASVVAVVTSLLPKIVEVYLSSRSSRPDRRRQVWAKVMPDVLDRHIRVDRTQCLDELEGDLTTYDVRPVGLLELDVPRMTLQRSLRLWKFPWVVSADQQTQSQESFILALANKLAAASFLSKIVTRAYSPDLADESVLRQWCLLVENCILEGSATASSINGVPMETVRLFPRDVQPLVAPFSTGNTIDNVVDNINRELYGPYTKGVLVTIGNTAFALGKLDSTIFAFNSSCHGDQVTDLFGAVLISTDFNTQNLQSVIKYMVDPYSPDAVAVYSIVPTEGFVFKSPEILEIEASMESMHW